MLAHNAVHEWFFHTIFYAQQPPTEAQTFTEIGPGTTDQHISEPRGFLSDSAIPKNVSASCT